MALSKLQLDEILMRFYSYASSPADLIVTLLGSVDYMTMMLYTISIGTQIIFLRA
jgi:hypothetical protein